MVEHTKNDPADPLLQEARPSLERPDLRTLDLVDTEIGKYLYTNTKAGHREAMFNITKRLRERSAPVAPSEPTWVASEGEDPSRALGAKVVGIDGDSIRLEDEVGDFYLWQEAAPVAAPPALTPDLEEQVCPKCGEKGPFRVEEDNGTESRFVACLKCGEVWEAAADPSASLSVSGTTPPAFVPEAQRVHCVDSPTDQHGYELCKPDPAHGHDPNYCDDADDYPMMTCPRCLDEQTDLDGFGFMACKVCGYCTHPSRLGNVCEICGEVEAEMPDV